MNIEVLKKVWTDADDGLQLGLQWCRYPFPEGDQYGYRFMWRDDVRGLHTDRGQARIPSAAIMFQLIQRATEAGWFVTVEQEQPGG